MIFFQLWAFSAEFKAKRPKVKAKQKVVQNSLPWMYQCWLEIASLLHKLEIVQASNFPVLHNSIHFHPRNKQNLSRLEITEYDSKFLAFAD